MPGHQMHDQLAEQRADMDNAPASGAFQWREGDAPVLQDGSDAWGVGQFHPRFAINLPQGCPCEEACQNGPARGVFGRQEGSIAPAEPPLTMPGRSLLHPVHERHLRQVGDEFTMKAFPDAELRPWSLP